jgi:hypothetical protein
LAVEGEDWNNRATRCQLDDKALLFEGDQFAGGNGDLLGAGDV